MSQKKKWVCDSVLEFVAYLTVDLGQSQWHKKRNIFT